MKLAMVVMILTSFLAAESLTVVSWGGAFGAAQEKHIIKPYEAKTGIDILFTDYSGGTAEIKAQVESGNVKWDVVDMEYVDLEKACSENLLERIDDRSFLLPGDDGTPAAKDFYPDAFAFDCAVGNIYWSVAFAYNKDTIGSRKPKTIKDLFNTRRFKGKRALRKRPEINMEWALIASGVSPKQVYKMLSTKKGQDRAFQQLNKIKNDIIWFDSWSQAPQLLNDGAAVMVQSANGRVTDFEVVWDAHGFDLDGWVIVKGSKNIEAAKKFIAYATSSKPEAGMKDVNYGPTRASAAALLTDAERANLPSAYLDKGFKVDSGFWADYKTELNERFNAWLLQ